MKLTQQVIKTNFVVDAGEDCIILHSDFSFFYLHTYPEL